jgi:hypothetical protein
VLRGGFGVYYDLGNGEATTAFGGFPFVSQTTFINEPYPLPPSEGVPPAFPAATLPINQPLSSLDPGLKLPYTLEWNVALQQSMGKQQVISVSYVAAIARNQLTTQLVNQGRPNPSVNPRPNPSFGDIYYTTNGPSSDYHSMQAQYQRRLSRGLQTLANYTWSHAIDSVSNEVSSVFDRGNADFDVRHNFSVAATYDLPKLRGSGFPARFIERIANGWSLSAIFLVRSGLPLNLTAGSFARSNGTLAQARPDVVLGVPFWINDPTVPGGRRLNPAAFQKPPVDPNDPRKLYLARQGTLGRNVVRLPGINQLNMSAARELHLTERVKLELRADVFNVLNHPLFGGYNNNASFKNPQLGIPGSMLSSSLNQTGAGGLNPLYQIGGPRSMQLSLRIRY